MTIMKQSHPAPEHRTASTRSRTAAALATALCALAFPHFALAKALTAIEHSGLAGNKVAITLTLDSAAEEPNVFTVTDPARLAIDLPQTDLAVADRSVDVGVGAVDGITAVQANGRTRVVINLNRLVDYDLETSGNQIRVLLASAGGATGAAAKAQPSEAGAENSITGIDFRRGEDGTGRVLINLSDPSVPIDVREEGGKVIANFLNTRLPERLERRLDVTDFATPVQTIDVRRFGNNVRMTITPSGNYEEIAYQAGDVFAVELKPVTVEQQQARQRQEFTGERLSLNFQDIEVRSVLQLIADFTGLNVVVSDSVTGNITLRLQDVPWDQALEIILRTKGLDMRRQGNVLLIAPAAEIAARERLELESQKQLRELAPIRTEFLQVNYAKASELATLIQNGETSLLSERGTVKIDPRTNTLIVQDTEQNLSDIRNLIARLDVPVRQVLIESRIVIATDDFTRDLGVRFGAAGAEVFNGDSVAVIGGSNDGYVDYGNLNPGYEVPAGSGNAGLIVDLPVVNPAGALSMAVGKIGSYLLQLELSAMEAEGRGSIVSSPRVITANQKPATIEQGVEIPYLEASSSGATSVSFKKAVLGLTVTPQITPDDRVLLDLEVSKDSRGQETLAGPAINTQSVTTQVLVSNGETVVLGGVYERTNTNGVTRVPLLGELPLIGALFRSTSAVDNRSELLVFVTPKILKESLALQ
jgi:type IV pilus assembly protein PilQ